MKTNYIVAGYPGPHTYHKKNNINYFYGDMFLQHVTNLLKLKHNLSKITLVINDFESPDKWQVETFKRAINDIKNQYPDLIEIMWRDNKYISYGGFLHAFEHRSQDYDKYILMECDYSFCIDWFDSKLIELQGELKLDAMFALWDRLGEPAEHGAISLGIINHNALAVTINNFKCEMRVGQFIFTKSFADCGFKCGDWRSKYKSLFYDSLPNKTVDFNNLTSAQDLCVPNHML